MPREVEAAPFKAELTKKTQLTTPSISMRAGTSLMCLTSKMMITFSRKLAPPVAIAVCFNVSESRPIPSIRENSRAPKFKRDREAARNRALTRASMTSKILTIKLMTELMKCTRMACLTRIRNITA